MSDIVGRLRKNTMHWYDESLAHEAAAEIDRLREEREKLFDECSVFMAECNRLREALAKIEARAKKFGFAGLVEIARAALAKEGQ